MPTRFTLNQDGQGDAAGLRVALGAVGDVAQMADGGFAPIGERDPGVFAGQLLEEGFQVHAAHYTRWCPKKQHHFVPDVLLHRGVKQKNVDTLIRQKNLKVFCEARGWGPNELVTEAKYGRYTYWRDLLNAKKSFGEQAARRFEETFGLLRGSLDSDDIKLSPRAVLLGMDFDAIADGDLKDSVYARAKRLFEEAVRGSPRPAAPAERELRVESKETLRAGQ